MVAQTLLMPPRKKNPNESSSKQNRSPFKMVRIRGALAQLCDQQAEVLCQETTQYINDAVRMRLEAEGLWPPKPKTAS